MSSSKLEEVTKALYEKGLQRGEEEAAKILREASMEAAKILKDAEEKSKAIIAQAENDADKIKNAVSSDIHVQFQYALDRISTKLALRLTHSALPNAEQPEKWVAILLDALIAQAIDQKNPLNDFSLGLPENWESQLNAALLSKIQALIQAGITIEADQTDPYQISLKNTKDGYRVEINPRELLEFIAQRLSTQSKKLLHLVYDQE